MEVLKQVIERLDTYAMWSDLEYLATLDKLSGSAQANEAADYIANQMIKYGIFYRMEVFQQYLSNPITAQLELLGFGQIIQCRPRSFSGHCPQGVIGQLVYDPNNWMDCGDEFLKQKLYESFRGKIVISHGFDEYYAIHLERCGALGWIQIWPSNEKQIHEDTVSCVWGTPTMETILLTPTIPIVGITAQTAQILLEHMEKQDLRVKLEATVETGVFDVKMPVAEIKGKNEDFVLVSCHYDTWFLGATDNCAANAAAIQIAKALFDHQEELERSVRIAWWVGHSNGRYAGSTWYCDHYWQELTKHCVAHITSDLIGNRNCNLMGVYTTGAEGQQFMIENTQMVDSDVAIQFHAIGRGADQSFWGAKIPLHFYTRYIRPKEEKDTATPGAGVFWWHTVEDTIDKVDATILFKDAKLLYLNIYRLLTRGRLPFSRAEYFENDRRILQDAAQCCDIEFDFSSIIQSIDNLDGLIQQIEDALDEESYNKMVKICCGGLNRLRQTYGSSYDHDLAFSGTGLYSRLCAVKGHTRFNTPSEKYLFLKTDFIRGRNRMLCELEKITREIKGLAVQ